MIPININLGISQVEIFHQPFHLRGISIYDPWRKFLAGINDDWHEGWTDGQLSLISNPFYGRGQGRWGTNFRDWQISGQVRFFNWHLFNFDHTHSIDNSFSKFSQKYFSFPVHHGEGRDERMVERCYLVFKWYLRWYLVIATASAAISLMTSNSFQL